MENPAGSNCVPSSSTIKKAIGRFEDPTMKYFRSVEPHRDNLELQTRRLVLLLLALPRSGSDASLSVAHVVMMPLFPMSERALSMVPRRNYDFVAIFQRRYASEASQNLGIPYTPRNRTLQTFPKDTRKETQRAFGGNEFNALDIVAVGALQCETNTSKGTLLWGLFIPMKWNPSYGTLSVVHSTRRISTPQ